MAFVWFPAFPNLFDAPAEAIIEVEFDPRVAPRRRTLATVIAVVTPDPPPPQEALIEVAFDPRVAKKRKTLESWFLQFNHGFNDKIDLIYDPRTAPKKRTQPSHFVQFTYGFNDFAETDFDPAVAPKKRTMESAYSQDAPGFNDMVEDTYDARVAPRKHTDESYYVTVIIEDSAQLFEFVVASVASQVYPRVKPTLDSFVVAVLEEGAAPPGADQVNTFPFIHNMGTFMQRS